MANAVNLAAAHNFGSVVGRNLGTINNIFNASPTHPANQCIEALDVTDAMLDRASITCPVEGPVTGLSSTFLIKNGFRAHQSHSASSEDQEKERLRLQYMCP
jgi:hypothetical protein